MSAVDFDDMPDDDRFESPDFDDVDDVRPNRIFLIGDHVELASSLLQDLGNTDDLVFDELNPWQYNARRGVYEEIDRARESRIVQGYSGAPTLPKNKPLRVKVGDVSGAIKLAHDQISHPGFFANSGAVAFTNKVVVAGASGFEVLDPSRDQRARAGYDFAYQPRALPRRFLEFLSGLFRDDPDRIEKENLVQEFFGACVLGIAPRYQRAIVGTGVGDNGKSTLFEVLMACMPAGTTTAIPPQDWGQEYRRALLVGKHLNAVGELPEREIIASESFKAIITGDPIVGRIIRESPLMFRPKAGHAFAANKLPGTSDQSEGFWRRFAVLTFNRSFDGDPSRDPHIREKVLEEKPAIVSWLLDGAARLMREKSFTLPSSHHAALASWRHNADHVALFAEATLRPLRERETGASGASLYQSYRDWCERNGHRFTLASNRFAERMQALSMPAKRTKHGMIYPVAILTASDRAAGVQGCTGWLDRPEVQGGAGSVQGHPSPVTSEDSNAF